MTPLLSILIPTIEERKDQFRKLVTGLYNEIKRSFPYPMIVVQWESDNKEMTIGEKRQRLYQKADGLYSIMIDDDDDLTAGALIKIIDAMGNSPDCITYLEYCSMNGRTFLANHALKYDDWADNQDGYDFVRTPYFKDVIKTEIARSVPVPFLRYSEDHQWSRALKPHLKTEVHLDEVIYLYQHNSKPEDYAKRYGFDQTLGPH